VLSSGKAAQKRWRAITSFELELQQEMYASLLEAKSACSDLLLITLVLAFFKSQPGPPPVAPSDIISWIGILIAEASPAVAGRLKEAMVIRKQRSNALLKERRAVASNIFFLKSPTAHIAHHSTFLHLLVRLLPRNEFYPTPGFWLAESKALFKLSADFYASQKLFDVCGKRHGVLLADEGHISLTIPAEANVLLYNSDSKRLVASVVRNFSGSPDMLKWAGGIVRDAVETRKSVRVRVSDS
jgi:hypothetical protein